MVEDRPNWRTGKLCYIELPAVGVTASAGFYRQASGSEHQGPRGRFHVLRRYRQRGEQYLRARPARAAEPGFGAAEPGFGIRLMVAEIRPGCDNEGRQADPGPASSGHRRDVRRFRDPVGHLLGVCQQQRGLAEMEAEHA